MTEKEAEAVSCPFCGAPYRKFIPANVVQIECQYCGGMFLVPPRIGVEILQCPNHSDRLAVGICNDCGESFCGECLHTYALETRGENAILYLCPSYLRKRYIQKAEKIQFSGVSLILFGIFSALISLPFCILVIIIGVVVTVYGSWKKSETPAELTIDEVRREEGEREAEVADMEGIDVEEIYNELLRHYINHWGGATGTELLENEIMAYVRHGVSFPEAVKKVYQRQKNKPS